jgi:glycosyltransferase involved in cell wall biosynthesis
MRICYLCADPGIPVRGTKGASVHVRGLVGAFTELGHEVLVLAGNTAGKERVAARVDPLPAPALREEASADLPAPMARALRHLWGNVAVDQALEAAGAGFRPDLLYERYSPFSAAGGWAARRLGIPHVLEVNAPLAWEGRTYRKQALSEAAEALEEAAFATAPRIVAVSRELGLRLQEGGVPGERILVVPNGVDTSLFQPEGEVLPAELSAEVVVGFVGSLKPWHGLDLLANAFDRVAGEDPRFHLLVVGNGPEAGCVSDLAARHRGRVTHVPEVQHRDIPAYLRRMDVAVAPYPALEGFYYSPLKVLEYMASGRAVVASAVGQLRDLLEPDVTGVLVPPGDPEALATALRRLADHPGERTALGGAAAEEARRRHGWRDRASGILEWAGGPRC